jgi:glycerol-3-phosphate acyltransferase PlsX
VSDGFSGNILLKSLEGAGLYIMSELRGVLYKNALSKFAGKIVQRDIKKLREKLDPDKVGGTALLGISKPVIKAHGSSNAQAICSAIRQAQLACSAHVAEKLSENIERMKVPEPGAAKDD